MPAYTYLIVGGGMTAAAAISGIREVDRQGSIGLIGSESHQPYRRPPLSKTLWKGDPLDSIWLSTESQGVSAHMGRTVQGLDARTRQVTDDQGTMYTYRKLLLATGCTPRRLPFGDGQIMYFRTVDDYQRLRGLTGEAKRIAIIGGGFIGSELAASLTSTGTQVVLIFPEQGIGGRMYPPELATFLNDFYRERGVELLTASTMTTCELRGGRTVLKIHGDPSAGGREMEIAVDGVVAGIGTRPNVALAESAGLVVDDGIRVDAGLRTSDPSIYAAGDVASVHDASLNEWRRVEHEDSANMMGGHAGVSMAGHTVFYDHLPFFYSDIFELGYEAVGEVNSRLQMVADWVVPCREGVIYYLRDSRVRGVLLWNIYGQVDAARRLIAFGEELQPEDLAGRLPA